MQILCKTNCYESNTCKEFEAGITYDLDPKFIKEHSMEKYFEMPIEDTKKVEKKIKVEKPETEEKAE